MRLVVLSLLVATLSHAGHYPARVPTPASISSVERAVRKYSEEL
jgi:hypothetical protein